MRKLIFFTSIALLVVLQVQAQAPAPAAAPVDTRKLAEEWMKRLNALSDWYISFDGKEEGVEQRVDSSHVPVILQGCHFTKERARSQSSRGCRRSACGLPKSPAGDVR